MSEEYFIYDDPNGTITYRIVGRKIVVLSLIPREKSEGMNLLLLEFIYDLAFILGTDDIDFQGLYDPFIAKKALDPSNMFYESS